jgi:serpin B
METDYDLIPGLREMGINDAFGPADFSGISNSGLYIVKAIHKAFVDVNEKGTEAAAATGIVMDESAPPSFRADHPFVFIIQDKETGNILFIGKVVDPTI